MLKEHAKANFDAILITIAGNCNIPSGCMSKSVAREKKVKVAGYNSMPRVLKFGNFREGFNFANFAYAKFRENKFLAKWRKHCVIFL